MPPDRRRSLLEGLAPHVDRPRLDGHRGGVDGLGEHGRRLLLEALHHRDGLLGRHLREDLIGAHGGCLACCATRGEGLSQCQGCEQHQRGGQGRVQARDLDR